MDAKQILDYLKRLMANNSREWYWEHKAEYDAVRADFEEGIKLAIGRIAEFDPSIAHLSVKDCTYRFNRDTRFSNDKSEGTTWRLLPPSGTRTLHGGLWQLLVAYEHSDLVSQRDDGQHQRVVTVCGEQGFPKILR